MSDDTTAQAVYDRFMSKVDTSDGPDSCHRWTGAVAERGYGRFWVNGNDHVRPHRWLLGYLRGYELTKGEVACHHCDNKLCCNPQHLYVGTQADNVRDMIQRNARAIMSIYAGQTHCKHGHEFTPENTYVYSGRPSERRCRTCAAIRDKDRVR